MAYATFFKKFTGLQIKRNLFYQELFFPQALFLWLVREVIRPGKSIGQCNRRNRFVFTLFVLKWGIFIFCVCVCVK